MTCPCQTRKQEVKCLATKTSPWSDRAASLALKCDDECLRLQRNAALASALGIDPATHTDDHVPYSDETLRMYREGVGGPGWCAATEREFRAFASADDSKEKRLRFKPMPSAQRAFIHALAEDYGLDSESLDPEPHRHVCVFKTPRFLAMHGGLPPRKTLAQCVRIRAAAEERDRKDARLAAVATASTASATEPPYNALLLTAPRFGLTADELDAVLAPAFAPHKGTLTFTAFFPEKDNDKHVILRLKPTAGTATSPSDSLVTSLKAAVERIVLRDVLAANVLRGTVVDGLSGTRPRVVRIEGRDGDASGGSQGGGGASAIPRGSGDGGGWSEVVGRAARRQQQQPAAAAATAAKDAAAGASRLSFGTVPDLAPRGLLALGKKKNAASTTALKQEDEPVEEDWLEAAEKMEREDKEPEET